MAYDFWLLDLDGTVVDVSDEYVQEVVGEVGARLGCGFTATEAERLWYGAEADREAVLDSRGLAPTEFWRTYHAVEDPVARAEATYVYDDAEAFLAGLDVPAGVVTHCQSYLAEPIMEAHDVADWFDAVVCCDEETGWKPDPRPVELAMADLGVGGNGHEGALAGDAPSDLAAARNAGLDPVHVARPPAADGDTPAWTARRIAALTDLPH